MFVIDQVLNVLCWMILVDQQVLLCLFVLYVDVFVQDNVVCVFVVFIDVLLICEGYQLGCIGDIVSLYVCFYVEYWGFGVFFEQWVVIELVVFVGMLLVVGKVLWLCQEDGWIFVLFVIDGDLVMGVVYLCWFIVNDVLCGFGVGC